MSVKNCDEAEEIARNYLLDKFDFDNVQFNSIDFDGSLFLVYGFEQRETEKIRFVVKVSSDGNVVGWELT